MKKSKFKLEIFMFLLLLMLSCKEETMVEPQNYTYQVPEQSNEGWETASLSDVGIDELSITRFMNELINNINHRIHGILIVKEGKLVFEKYFQGYAFYHGALTEYDRATRHSLASVTKSFASAIVGIAFGQGSIQNVEQKAFSFFPEYDNINHSGKEEITLKHLLTMSAGLEWDESSTPYSDPRNDLYQIWHQYDPIRFVLSKSIVSEPGAEFHYNSGLTNVLGEIVHKATGIRADNLAHEFLFTPLGITDYSWEELPHHVLYVSGDLQLLPRDVAKFGELYLRGGMWNGQRILPEWWIRESVKSQINANQIWDYGYQWWLHKFQVGSNEVDSFVAAGWGGQYIFVFPSLEMVVVTTAGYYDEPELEFHIKELLVPVILSSAL